MKALQHVTPARSLAVLALLATLIAAPCGSHARPKSSGITGQVLLHNHFVANLGRQREATVPFCASLQIYSATTGAFIKSVTTDTVDRFEVELPPGDYLVVPDRLSQGRVLQDGDIVIGLYEETAPVQVNVRKHHATKLVITYEECLGS
jgi:hypothetical protein